MNVPRPLLTWLGKNLESAHLGRYPHMKENLQKYRLLLGRFEHIIGENKSLVTGKAALRGPFPAPLSLPRKYYMGLVSLAAVISPAEEKESNE